jgi:hypothetical protein
METDSSSFGEETLPGQNYELTSIVRPGDPAAVDS